MKSSNNSAPTSFSIRTQIYSNKKFNSGGATVKGNASPLTTQGGRISVGEKGVFWSGQLPAWSVQDGKNWSSVMFDANSPACGLVGVLQQVLVELEAVEETEEALDEAKKILAEMQVSFDLPLDSEKLIEVYEHIHDSGKSFFLQGDIELFVGVGINGLSITGHFVGDIVVDEGKVLVVESGNRLKVDSVFSVYAKPAAMDMGKFSQSLKAGITAQGEKNITRRSRYQTKATTQVAEVAVADSTENNSVGLPPAV